MPRADPAGLLILARHGETGANVKRCFAASAETPLTGAGQKQSRRLASRLGRLFRPEAIFTSEFLRARQTGEIVAHKFGLGTHVISGIQERDFGALKGCPHEDLGTMMELDPAYCRERPQDWSPPGGENLDEVRLRSVRALERVTAANGGREIVAITHGAVIQAVCAHLTGAWSEANVPPNCGIVVVAYDQLGLRRIVPPEPSS